MSDILNNQISFHLTGVPCRRKKTGPWKRINEMMDKVKTDVGGSKDKLPE